MEEIEGTVEGLIYENETNGYTVCDVSSDGKLFTLTGCMPGLCEGERIKAYGEWRSHREYGEQFNVRAFERIMPETESEIEMYLGSGMLPHIGKATARKIVELFGRDALDVIENEPERLTEIRGISVKKAQEIYKKFLEQICVKEIVVFFQKFGVSPSLSVKAYRAFGEATVSAVRANPFVLSAIDGFTFKICDRICDSMELPKDFPPRICAGIKSVLMNAAYLSGHTYLPKGSLLAQARYILGVETEAVEDAIYTLTSGGELTECDTGEFEAVYLDTFYTAETAVAERLRTMSGTVFEVNDSECDGLIADAESESGIILADAQRDAVRAVFENTAVVITGGPGTGKTTIIKTIINIMEKQGKRIVLTAPTGRAAKRMTELCGTEAKTIHRLLENTPGMDGQLQTFARNEKNKLECDLLIVDEMSMVDILLMHSLLLALPTNARLVMVGDSDQLPAVGAGNVLRDIIESDALVSIRLTEIFRQAHESMIVVNAHRINNGEMPLCNDPDNDFFMLKCENPNVICETIADLCKTRLPRTYGYDSISQIQVITPTRKTQIGVQSLNELLQSRLNPPQKFRTEKQGVGCVFRVGDKVMQNKNNYDAHWTRVSDGSEGEGIFNGDVGFVTDIDLHEKNMTVMFDDDRKAVYDFLSLDELELAYAITVHKSQGSEFDVVIMPMFDTHRLLMTRNLLYTAVTRAKKLAILVGKTEILEKFVQNNNISVRYSGLKERMEIR